MTPSKFEGCLYRHRSSSARWSPSARVFKTQFQMLAVWHIYLDLPLWNTTKHTSAIYGNILDVKSFAIVLQFRFWPLLRSHFGHFTLEHLGVAKFGMFISDPGAWIQAFSWNSFSSTPDHRYEQSKLHQMLHYIRWRVVKYEGLFEVCHPKQAPFDKTYVLEELQCDLKIWILNGRHQNLACREAKSWQWDLEINIIGYFWLKEHNSLKLMKLQSLFFICWGVADFVIGMI